VTADPIANITYPVRSIGPNITATMKATIDDIGALLGPTGTHTRRGSARLAAPTVVAAGPSWTTLATLTSTSHGGLCDVDVHAILANSNSGANQIGALSVTLDGTALTPTSGVEYALPLIAGINAPYAAGFNWESTPAAGSHTWVLRANANAASSVTAMHGVMTVTEHP